MGDRARRVARQQPLAAVKTSKPKRKKKAKKKAKRKAKKKVK